MPTTPPTLTPTPTPAPQRNDRTTFSAQVDAFVTWCTTAVAEFAALATNCYNNAVDCYNNAVASAAFAASSAAQVVLATAQTAAATAQVVIATTQAGLAAVSAATAANAPGTSATSASSLTVGAGALSLTIQTGKSLAEGMNITVARTSDPSGVQMPAIITAYNSGTGLLNFTTSSAVGSGTFTDWTVSLSGARGIPGTNGSLYVATATNAVAGNTYFTNTSAAPFTITMPASPVQGDIFTFVDSKSTWATNNLTIARNGHNVLDLNGDSTAEDLVCDMDGLEFTMFYDAPNWRLS